MANKTKKDFHLGFKHVLRITIFLLVFFYIISLLAKHNSNKQPLINSQQSQSLLEDIGSHLYSQIPDQTKQKFSNIPNTPVVKGVSQKITDLKDQALSLPAKLWQDLKKEIATTIYQSIIGNHD